VDPRLVGKLIGLRGSNIRRITDSVRDGCFIRGHPDGTFVIEAWTETAVKQARKMLKQDEKAFNSGDRPTKPTKSFKSADGAVGYIIGKYGAGIKGIMRRVGDGCYIVHKDGEFVVTANTMEEVERAMRMLRIDNEDWIDRFSKPQPQPVKERKPVVVDTNSFAVLQVEGSPPSSPREAVAAAPKRVRQWTRRNDLVVYGKGRMDALKTERHAKYGLRATMAAARGVEVSTIEWTLVDQEWEKMKASAAAAKAVQKQDSRPRTPDTSSDSDFPGEHIKLDVAEKSESGWGNSDAVSALRNGGGGQTYHIAPPTRPRLPRLPAAHALLHKPLTTVEFSDDEDFSDY